MYLGELHPQVPQHLRAPCPDVSRSGTTAGAGTSEARAGATEASVALKRTLRSSTQQEQQRKLFKTSVGRVRTRSRPPGALSMRLSREDKWENSKRNKSS